MAIFGFGKKKAPERMRELTSSLAQQSQQHLGVVMRHGQPVYREFAVFDGELGYQGRLAEELRALVAGLSAAPEGRDRTLDNLQKEIVGNEGASLYRRAAFGILMGLIKTDLCCKAAMEYPEDDEITGIATIVSATNYEAVDRIFSEEANTKGPLDPTPALDFYREMPNWKRFMEKQTGLNKIFAS